MSPASSPSASPKSAAPKSMTGYAQAHIEQNGWSLRVSVRSVNHRFLDLHLHLPEGFEPFEPRMRQLLRERVRSEEHTSELQSRLHLVCRLLLEKKKIYT